MRGCQPETVVWTCSGRMDTLLDSDDEWVSLKLEKQVQYLQEFPHLRAIHTDEKWVRNNNEVNPPVYLNKSNHLLWERSLRHCLICPSSVLLHKSIFETIGSFDQSLTVCEDYDFWLRLLLQDEIDWLMRNLPLSMVGMPINYPPLHGDDRFRIKTLQNSFQSFAIPEPQKLVYEVLIDKCRILAWFKKRQKTGDAEVCKDSRKYSVLLKNNTTCWKWTLSCIYGRGQPIIDYYGLQKVSHRSHQLFKIIGLLDSHGQKRSCFRRLEVRKMDIPNQADQSWLQAMETCQGRPVHRAKLEDDQTESPFPSPDEALLEGCTVKTAPNHPNTNMDRATIWNPMPFIRLRLDIIRELVQVIKMVSDNPTQPVDKFSPKEAHKFDHPTSSELIFGDADGSGMWKFTNRPSIGRVIYCY